MERGGTKMRIDKAIGTDRRNYGTYSLALLLLAAGVIAGSVYLVKSSASSGEGIKAYIENFFAMIAENKNSMEVFKNSLIEGVISLGIIFAMGFFRLGFVITGAVLVRKGFIMGFTAASFFKFYGLRGMLVMLSTTPTVIITLPALLLFSTVSVKISLIKEKKQKNLIFSYIFLLAAMISIFCVASLAEGYLTTTFMNWLSPKIV